MVKAEAVVSAARQALQPFTQVADRLAGLLPILVEFFADDALQGLPALDALQSLRGARQLDAAERTLEELSGRLSETIDALSGAEDLSVAAPAEACRAGSDDLVVDFGTPTAQAEGIATAGNKLAMAIEELKLPHVTGVECSVGPESAPPEWRKLNRLSDLSSDRMGAMDMPKVAALVEEILEGGKEAFQKRRMKHGLKGEPSDTGRTFRRPRCL